LSRVLAVNVMGALSRSAGMRLRVAGGREKALERSGGGRATRWSGSRVVCVVLLVRPASALPTFVLKCVVLLVRLVFALPTFVLKSDVRPGIPGRTSDLRTNVDGEGSRGSEGGRKVAREVPDVAGEGPEGQKVAKGQKVAGDAFRDALRRAP